jgi:glycosyltransferase involved in cell wall biosynthesis
LNILSLTYEYPPIGGGGAAVSSALNRQLAALGHRVRVVTSAMKDLSPAEVLDGVEIHRASCWRRYRHYSTALELLTTLRPAYRLAAKLIEAQRPDVIHVHFALPSGIVAYWLSKRFNIPYVLTVHGSDIPGYNPDRFKLSHRIASPIWKHVIRGAAIVTSPSEFLARLLRQQLQIPVHIVRNGYNAALRQGRQRRKLVLVVARLFPRKGVQHFLQAVSGLPAEWEYLVVGDGPYMESLKAQAADVASPAKFAGFINQTELIGLYEEASIFVFPSIQENFPMVLLEAMDAGCAIITTDAEGCAEVVGNTGIVIEKSNSLEIRRSLVQLMGSSTLRRELAAQSEARVKDFRWSRIAAQYTEVFQAVLDKRAPKIHNLGGVQFAEHEWPSVSEDVA